MASPTTYFDSLYSNSDDPWSLRVRWYERRKRQLTMAALPRERYRCAFEPGCSNGELSALLATRCDAVVALDLNESAVRLARERLAGMPNVSVEPGSVPHAWPAREFDLIVLSEIAYYFDEAELEMLAQKIRTTLSPDGTLIACHWRHRYDEAMQSAEAVHASLHALSGLPRIVHHEESDLLLDVWTAQGWSVAQEEGIA
jgi:cyclopropane fatty-acyl-phospholipid synthase-like methyltransferase